MDWVLRSGSLYVQQTDSRIERGELVAPVSVCEVPMKYDFEMSSNVVGTSVMVWYCVPLGSSSAIALSQSQQEVLLVCK